MVSERSQNCVVAVSVSTTAKIDVGASLMMGMRREQLERQSEPWREAPRERRGRSG